MTTTGNFSTTYRDTVAQLRYLFDQWGIKQAEWQVNRDGYEDEKVTARGVQRRWVQTTPAVTISYLRQGQWQQLRCAKYATYDANLRAIYLLLERMRLSEGHGVQYGGLTSSRELAPAIAQRAPVTLLDQARADLHVSWDAPFDVIEASWRRLVRQASDAGDDERMKRLNNAFNFLKESLSK